MAIKNDIVTRVFVFDKTEHTDPNPALSPVQVIKILAEKNPKILNASLNAPEFKDGKLYFKLESNTGTKG